MMRKACAALLAMTMCTSLLAGCGNTTETKGSEAKSESQSTAASASATQKESVDTVEEFTYPMETDVTLDMFAGSFFGLASTETDYKNSQFWQWMCERTGVTVDMEYTPTGGDAKQTLNLILADPKTMPNLVGNIKLVDAEEYINDGVILDLTPYLEEYAPNYWARLQDPANEERRRLGKELQRSDAPKRHS